MALSVNSNIQALNAYRNLNKTQSAMSNSLEKLSSGLRINRAADDAAGLAISENLKAQIGGIQQASKNAQDGVSLVQTADGALGTVHTLLQRLRTLAIQAANGSQSSSSRAAINQEAVALKAELTRISQTSNFNGVNLLDGTFKTAANFQIGYRADDAANGVQGNKIAVSLDSGAAALTVNAASATKAAAIAGVAASANVTTDYDFSMTGATFTSYTGGAVTAAGMATGASLDFSNAASYVTVSVKLDGVAATLLVASNVGTSVGFANALQTQLNGAYGAGRVTVGTTATSGLTFAAGANEKAGANSTFQVVAVSTALNAASLGLSVGAAVSGTASRALSVDVTVDGTTKTLSVSTATFNTNGLVSALNTAANTAFGNNQAVFAASGNTITFASGASANTGSTSSVKIGAITLGDANSSVIYGLASNTTSTGTDAVTAATTKAGAFDSNGLGVGALDLSNQASAQAAVGLIDAAITQVSTSRASLGALQNRFQYTVDNLDTTAENLSSAQSRILDTDMASEMVSFTRSQILSQAGSAMLSQAKNLPSSLLELLKS